MNGKKITANNKPMLNAYPDSMGGTLGDITDILKKEEMKDVFSSFYILPSVFNTDLDRGFSVINYDLNQIMAKPEDFTELEKLGIDTKLDFILNHASVLSEQFQDVIKNGDKSKYKDFFINWNTFWADNGEMTEEGYIQPNADLIKNMFFRKPGLPILMVRFPDGKNVPYWNTFYQDVKYPILDAQDIMNICDVQYCVADVLAKEVNEGIEAGKKPCELDFDIYNNYKDNIVELLESKRKYLGQMDLNIKSPLVWEFYDDTLKRLAEYGAKIVRLDAFAYAPKEVGERNFLNEPGTWDTLKKVRELADKYNLTLLPEIHASYGEKQHETIAEQGYMTYDFFLPGLIIDALESGSGKTLIRWAKELQDKHIHVVNMLGCHDGIPLLDLKGLISDEKIEQLINIVVGRGGMVKNLHSKKNLYYQVNSTYYSALGEDDRKLLMARALQLFMPGKPQIWYLDLFAGKNDYEAVKRSGALGHKEINRSNLTKEQIEEALKSDVVKSQLDMLKFRNTFAAFDFNAELEIMETDSGITFIWKYKGCIAKLNANLKTMSFDISGVNENGEVIYDFEVQ